METRKEMLKIAKTLQERVKEFYPNIEIDYVPLPQDEDYYRIVSKTPIKNLDFLRRFFKGAKTEELANITRYKEILVCKEDPYLLEICEEIADETFGIFRVVQNI